MTKRKPTPSASPVPKFAPVRVRRRHDGWTPERQTQFIEALAECGCVADACRRVGMSSESAYALRRHYDAQAFRLAWDAALDYAIRRLSDAAFRGPSMACRCRIITRASWSASIAAMTSG
jgi:hypothetical protein